MFLGSPQGMELATRFNEELQRPWTTALATIGVGIVVFMATGLSQIVAANSQEPSPVPAPDQHGPIAIGLVWATAAGLAFGTALAIRTSSPPAYAALTLLIAIYVVSGWLMLSNAHGDAPGLNALSIIRRHRILLAVGIIALAALPLWAFAQVSMRAPNELAWFGPLLVVMVGLAANATLVGMVFIAAPLSVHARWLSFVLIAIVLSWHWTRAMHLDVDNPLLRGDVSLAIGNAERNRSCTQPRSRVIDVLRNHTSRTATALPPDIIADRDAFLVSAEGGGIRAAYWTAVALEHADGFPNDQIRERVAVVSGVSGGSLGVATWIAVQERKDLDAKSRLALME